MSEISGVALFGKLNSLAFKTIDGATTLCKLRGNPYVELEHWLMQMANTPDCDLHRIVRRFDIDPSKLAADLTSALDRLPRGASSISSLAEPIADAIERAWVYASLKFGATKVRTGHLLFGMLKTPRLASRLLATSRQFERIQADVLGAEFAKIVAGGAEDALAAEAATPGGAGTAAPTQAGDAMAAPQLGQQQALAKYAQDLTAKAKAGALDPVSGRDEEIRQIVDILMRRRQNNPLLTGEAGVGKTAVVEGFALRLARGDVPPALREVQLWSLDLGLLQAGASMKGEFEQRLRQLIDEVQASARPIILFVDEVHTLVGAGGAAGTGDAANLLKPALARGTLRTIGATTWAEYKKHIEKDPALTRRFQVVQVPEPDEAKAVLMLRGVAAVLEKHHRVLLLDEAIEAAVKLSHRYIPARQLPDKAVSLLDTSCARVAISQHATPPEVEDSQRRIEALQVELDIIGREQAVGIDAGARRAAAEERLRAERERLAALEARWQEEKALVDRILALRGALRAAGQPVDQGKGEGEGEGEGVGDLADDADRRAADIAAAEALTMDAAAAAAAAATTDAATDAAAARAQQLAELQQLQAQLQALQGETPLILPSVDAQAVSSVVADWTGIPVGRMVRNEIESVLKLADTLGQRIVGQRHALDMIARRIQTSRARLDNPNKPVGVFMLAGTSGVGKTETALALAEALYGGEQNLVTINMSEYQEAHTISTLKGAPPGYVGYGEGGVLTEAVRRRPYSVVLLDEVEKAHPDVHELFFQVFDKGWMEDGEGRVIDFRNTLILLTTNVGTELIERLCRDPARLPEAKPEPEALTKALRPPLLQVFPPALLGRLVVVPYYPLSDDMLRSIVRLQLGRIKKRIADNHRIAFEWDDAVEQLIVARCTEGESGGRMVDAILTNTVLPEISGEMLQRMAAAKPFLRVQLRAASAAFDYQFD